MAKLDSPQAITRRATLVLGLAGAVGAGAVALARRGPRTPDRIGDFDLPALPELKGPNGFSMKGFGAKDLAGHMSMVTLFASWRPECRAEHDRLIELAARVRSPVFGALSLDKTAAGVRFLSARGNPFRAVGDNSKGAFARALGAPGVPASYVVAPDLRIVRSYLGEISAAAIKNEIIPLLGKI